MFLSSFVDKTSKEDQDKADETPAQALVASYTPALSYTCTVSNPGQNITNLLIIQVTNHHIAYPILS